MQNPMNERNPVFVMIPVPLAVLKESGIDVGDFVQFASGDGVVVMEAVTDLDDLVCDGDCENCPCSDACGESEV